MLYKDVLDEVVSSLARLLLQLSIVLHVDDTSIVCVYISVHPHVSQCHYAHI